MKCWYGRSLLIASMFVTSCVNLAENYEPAGFKSMADARQYVPYTAYFAKRLTATEWSAFYDRFPDYWQDLQTAKNIGMSLEYHPIYTAYAFRWTTLNRAAAWNAETLARLNERKLTVGDDLFKLVFALGPPHRLIWNNNTEALLYSSGATYFMRGGVLWRMAQCDGCTAPIDVLNRTGFTDRELAAHLLQFAR